MSGACEGQVSIRGPGTRVKGDCELHCGYWKQHAGPHKSSQCSQLLSCLSSLSFPGKSSLCLSLFLSVSLCLSQCLSLSLSFLDTFKTFFSNSEYSCCNFHSNFMKYNVKIFYLHILYSVSPFKKIAFLLIYQLLSF